MDDELKYVVENMVEIELMNSLIMINQDLNQMIHDDYSSFDIVMYQSKQKKSMN